MDTTISEWVDKAVYQCGLDVGLHTTLTLVGRLTPLYTAIDNNCVIAKPGSTLQTCTACQLHCKPSINVVGVRVTWKWAGRSTSRAGPPVPRLVGCCTPGLFGALLY